MANIVFIIECEEIDCFEVFEIEKQFDAKNSLPSSMSLFKSAKKNGWHIGLRTLCPNCAKKQRDTCKNCKHYINKSMGIPHCDNYNSEPVVSENDFCCKFERR